MSVNPPQFVSAPTPICVRTHPNLCPHPPQFVSDALRYTAENLAFLLHEHRTLRTIEHHARARETPPVVAPPSASLAPWGATRTARNQTAEKQAARGGSQKTGKTATAFGLTGAAPQPPKAEDSGNRERECPLEPAGGPQKALGRLSRRLRWSRGRNRLHGAEIAKFS